MPSEAWKRQLAGRSAVLSVRLDGVPDGSGLASEWLCVIWEINAIAPETIGEPLDLHDWKPGFWAEEYSAHRVILGTVDKHTNYVQAFTPEAAALLKAAVANVTGRVVDDNGMCTRKVLRVGNNVPHGYTTPVDALDLLTKQETAFESFEQMVSGTDPHYRPTIFVDSEDRILLADAYDRAQERRHDSRRAYRAKTMSQLEAEGASRPTADQMRQAAREIIAEADMLDVDIDGDAEVSWPTDCTAHGAYVQAWIWVPFDSIESEGATE